MPFFRRKSKHISDQISDQIETAASHTSLYTEDTKNAQVKKRIAIIGSGVSGLTCAH